jgi:NADH:ubiquinone oxidoreductase subunit D
MVSGPEYDKVIGERMLLHIGPQHPAQPGPFRIDVLIEGERIIEAYLDIGFVHKGIEKISEIKTYNQVIPITDRICYLASITNNICFCRVVEQLYGIDIPERAKWLRTLVTELSRIQSHTLWFGEFTNDLGFNTMFMYMVREREAILDLLTAITGARLNHSYARIGGVRQDIPEGFAEMVVSKFEAYEEPLKKNLGMLVGNDVINKRLKGVGILPENDAKRLGVTGPALRASGVDFDLRRNHPYDFYNRVDFDVITREEGDAYSRFEVRIDEVWESMKIIRQLLEQPPEGPITSKLPKRIAPPRGEAWARVSDPRGEMGMYLVSDGSEKPYRLKVRGPAFGILQALPPLLKGVFFADINAIAGSMDSCTSEVDR